MAKYTFALVVIFCIGVIIEGANITSEKEINIKDNFSSLNFDMKRTLKVVQRNVTLKKQIALIKGQIKTLKKYHKNLQTQKKHLQAFKIALHSKINKTHVQTYKLVKLQKQIKNIELKMINLSLQMKTIDVKVATIQAQLKKLEKQLKALYKENRKLTGKSQRGKDCADLYKKGEKKNGVYQINPDGQGYFKVFCDMKSSGGGWTVFQRRQDGSVNFYRGWKDYKQGFGDLTSEFWLGLDKIYRLTSARRNKLRVDLGDWSGNKAYVEYDYFAVKNENKKYQLSLGKYSGNAGDSLSYHNGMAFSTKDSDNDKYKGNCAINTKGAWWYNRCNTSNLNGHYYSKGYSSWSGVVWFRWKNNTKSLKFTEMKLKP
ncbi:angiopoietin-related protein 7-like [Xenia sp. Carnegie-2017]|uniref:angiopoietin-related protein 7-like n=1 Tax=Xenia sp. Carnegie-2017 TaxID=2897299 RepID=UPI001F042511|nr:angiopoietin-related protein 7-like [Xenia sp. Carnegie-2017]